MGYGLRVVTDDPQLIEFQIDDFNLYYHTSNDVCSKQHPTEDMYARIKALRRWFPDFPSYKELFSSERCIISISVRKNKVIFGKLQAILQRQKSALLKPPEEDLPNEGSTFKKERS